MAACVPAIRPIYLAMFHPRDTSEYSSYSRSKKSYMLHPSSHDRKRGPGARRVDPESNGCNGDGEGLVKPDDEITQTVELDVVYENTDKNRADANTHRQAEEGW